MDITDKKSILKFIRANTPVLLTSVRGEKLIYPFRSKNAYEKVNERISAELYKELNK